MTIITVTDPAKAHIDRIIEKSGKRYFRLHVKSAGCSGYRYEPEVVDELQEGDQVFDCDGWEMLLSEAAIPLVKGTTLDYVTEGLSHRLVFKNPNAEDECGCGESFNVIDPDEDEA